MNARAISGVVSPPTRLSVSATCASAARDGWQHAKISSSRSSGIAASSSAGSSAARASSSVFRASVCSRRIRSIAPFRAVATIQAPGLAGAPSTGQRSAALTNAS
jgi:hypothetical protein